MPWQLPESRRRSVDTLRQFLGRTGSMVSRVVDLVFGGGIGRLRP